MVSLTGGWLRVRGVRGDQLKHTTLDIVLQISKYPHNFLYCSPSIWDLEFRTWCVFQTETDQHLGCEGWKAVSRKKAKRYELRNTCDYIVNFEAFIILLQRILLQDIGKLLYIVWKTLRNISNDYFAKDDCIIWGNIWGILSTMDSNLRCYMHLWCCFYITTCLPTPESSCSFVIGGLDDHKMFLDFRDRHSNVLMHTHLHWVPKPWRPKWKFKRQKGKTTIELR